MQVIVGAFGWQSLLEQQQFFPDDLPVDWRLGYYANEFDALLLPYSEWSKGTALEIESWTDELPDAFTLFFEACSHSDTGKAGFADQGGHPLPQVRFALDGSEFSDQAYLIRESVFFDQNATQSHCIVLRVFAENEIKTIELSQMIRKVKESYCQSERVYLFFEGALLTMITLNSAQTIVDLLCSEC